MIVRTSDIPTNDFHLVPQSSYCFAQLPLQLSHILATHVPKFDPFKVLPYPFIRVQFRRIPWQPLQVYAPATTTQHLFDFSAPMNWRSIPDDQQLAFNLPQQVAQESSHICSFVCSLLHHQVQSAFLINGTDGRQMISADHLAQHRRLTSRRIGAHYRGQQVETGLVYPEDYSPFPPGLFLIAGHRLRDQLSIAASSRWRARRAGTCKLQPTSRSRRPTCDGWYETPHLRRITSEMRWRVHTSPRNPQGFVPCESNPGKEASCLAVRRRGAPLALRWRKAEGPSLLARVTHWLTAPGVTPRACAIADCDHPACFNSQARRRRPSRQSTACDDSDLLIQMIMTSV